MTSMDIIETVQRGLDKYRDQELDPAACVMAPDMYAAMVQEATREDGFEVTTTRAEIETGYVGAIEGVPVYISQAMPAGQVVFIPRQALSTIVRQAKGQFPAPKFGDTLGSAASMVVRGVQPGPVVEANPPPLKEPYDQIRIIHMNDLTAYDEDDKYLLTLTREGACHLADTYPNIRWEVSATANLRRKG